MRATLKSRGEGIQHVICREVVFDHLDFPSTAAVPVFEIPGNAIPLGGFLAIESAFDATSTLAVGDGTTPNLYLAATSATALARTDLDADWLNGGKPLGARKTIHLTSSEAQAQGKGRLVVWYILVGRNHSTQG